MTRILRRIDSPAAAPRRLAFETCERRLALSTTVESFAPAEAAADDFTLSPALAEGFFSFDATVQVRSTTNLKSDAPLGDLQIQGEFRGQTTSVWDRSILTNFALEPRSNSVSGTVDFTPITPASDAATLSDPFPSAEAEIIVDRPPGQVIYSCSSAI